VFYIIEEESKLENLQRLSNLGFYIEVISSNDNFHPKLTSTVAVYVRPLKSKRGFIIPVNHDEGLNVSKERISQLLLSCKQIYTYDKKELLYHFNIQSAIDLSLLYSMVNFDKLQINQDVSTVNYYYNRYSNFKNINQLIPLSKLFEKYEKRYNSIEKYLDLKIPDNFNFYNNIATNVFFLLEQSGLGIYYEAFNEMFNPKDPLYNIVDNTVLTSYNLYNVTSRPTNAFNSVNFAAIPKGRKFRSCFHPKGDYFIELDFDGYHLRLLCEQIGYPLSDESAHKQLAKLYFEKEEITDEEYNEAKQINFQAIYGKIPEKHAFLDVFEKIDGFIKDLWSEYETNGRVLAPISNKPFTKTLKDMHPQKLMNYVMQSLETSRNILIIKEVLRYLKDKKTQLVLYTYDALLFDFYKEDGEETVEMLKEILESGGKYPTRLKYSKDLSL
tara:strand:+ start:1805 stop:3130 length:1326 start_codon:yes stop_codon:yes gene_type:complete